MVGFAAIDRPRCNGGLGRSRVGRVLVPTCANQEAVVETLSRRIGAVVAYVAMILVPLALALLPPRPEGRQLAVEVGVALGFVAFAVLGGQFLLTARFPRLAAPFGMDWLLRLHRTAGIAAALAVLAHIGVLVVVEPRFRAFLNPFDDLARAAALWLVIGALFGLVALTIWRRQFGLPYQWWRLTHGSLALVVMVVAVVHIFRVGHYSAVPWKMAAWGLYGMGAAFLLVWTRVIRPIRSLRRPWTVVEVRREKGRAWTVALEPEGHEGMAFKAGQFAWLALDQPPWHIDVHPYSFSSSSELDGRIEFTIKELGDFTALTGQVPVGARAHLDGPYGNFVLDDAATGAVFVVGGIGVTPALSILRTMRDRQDHRPVWMVFGAGHPDKVIAWEELTEMAADGSLTLTVVVENADDDWTGERGLITESLLQRALPPLDTEGLEVFCCGPREMMDAVLPALRHLGAPPQRLRSERFDLA
jgi:predicted ferric reductase